MGLVRGDATVSLLVLAKEPQAGRVKTRLCPPFSSAQAARLAAAALTDTLAAGTATRAVRRVLVLDGNPSQWQHPGWDLLVQRGAGLGERLAAAYDDDFATAGLPMLLIGMDTPQLTAAMLDRAVATLLTRRRRCRSGGRCRRRLVGTRVAPTGARAFDGVPMSTPFTALHQRNRLGQLGLHTVELPVLRDVDTPADAVSVARGAPGSRFVTALALTVTTLATAQ
jgi:glycosyltransferase A (GT-A) superfamily protein (DUF2064 family)